MGLGLMGSYPAYKGQWISNQALLELLARNKDTIAHLFSLVCWVESLGMTG